MGFNSVFKGLNHYRNCRVCRAAQTGSFPALNCTYRIRISP